MVRKFEEFFPANTASIFGVTNDLEAKVEKGLAELQTQNKQLFELVSGLCQAVRHLYETNQRVDAQLSTVVSEIATIREVSSDTLALTSDAKDTHYIGKKTEILSDALEKAMDVTFEEVRKAVYRATGNQQEVYNILYGKLYDQVGFDVYAAGKKSIKKSDNLTDADGPYVRAPKTYYNAAFLAGYKAELYLLAKEMIRS